MHSQEVKELLLRKHHEDIFAMIQVLSEDLLLTINRNAIVSDILNFVKVRSTCSFQFVNNVAVADC